MNLVKGDDLPRNNSSCLIPSKSMSPGSILICLKVKFGVLRPVQQPGSFWVRSSALTFVGS